MTSLVLLVPALAAAAAAGLLALRALRALPAARAEHLLAGLAFGLGLAGIAALGLAVAGRLRSTPIALLGAAALVAGGRDLVRACRALDPGVLRRAWPLVLVSALVLAAEVPTMLAPPVGGDQTKYQLVYPRLYALAGGLVPTPWSFWGHVQFLPNFVFALGFAASGEVLARLLNGTLGVAAALALATLAGRHLAPRAGAVAGALFFTLPISWSLMTHAGVDLAVVLYAALATTAFLAWVADGSGADLRRAALMAGLAGGSKPMGLLVPALLGAGLLAVLARRAEPARRRVRPALAFGLLALLAASPWYVRNAAETGNPIYPFGYSVFGGRHWSSAASEYLRDYYRQYQTTWAERREGTPYAGLEVVSVPWDLTMHPDSFENGARQSMDVSPFAFAFAPAVLLVRRRRFAVLATAALGLGYAGIVAAAAWAHPRYVLPGLALVLVAGVPAARALLPRRLFAAAVALTIAGNLALTTGLLQPLWPDQVRVAAGLLAPADFLRRHSARFAFWERANAEVPAAGLVLVLEKIPHPYYIDRPFVLGSYMEQGLLDYRTLVTPAALAAAAHGLGVTHVAIQLAGLEAAGDPFEASVARLWRGFLIEECDPPLVREGGYALYTLRAETGPTALAAAATITRTDSCVLSEATTAVTPGLRPSAASDRNARLRDGVLEGAHRRSRLGRTHARLRPLAEPAADACGPDGARCTRPHAEHASTHHGAGLDFDDVEPRPG